MPNFNNFKTDIPSISTEYVKYLVSRTVSIPKDELIEVMVPTTIPENFSIEVALYSLSDNSLVYKCSLPVTDDAVQIQNFIYADGTVRRMMFINFSKLGNGSVLDVVGRWEMVINFVVNEIGGGEVFPLNITEISPSRKEVELRLAPEYRTPESASKLVNFASPQINSIWVLEALKYICNQTQSLNPNIPTEKTSLTFDILQEFLPEEELVKISGSNVNGEYTASIKNSTQILLNTMYGYASQSIQNDNGQVLRYTDKMLYNIVSSSLGKAMNDYMQPQNFNFV